MLNQKVLDEIVTKVNELLAQSPVKDVEKNLRVMLSGMFTRLDLVHAEEFEVQQEVRETHARETGGAGSKNHGAGNPLRNQTNWMFQQKRWMICRKRNNAEIFGG